MIVPGQLDPPLPVRVVASKDWRGPTGNAMAIAWFQESIDHSLTFVVVMDATGEVWEVEQPSIRFRSNITWGRASPEGKKDHGTQ